VSDATNEPEVSDKDAEIAWLRECLTNMAAWLEEGDDEGSFDEHLVEDFRGARDGQPWHLALAKEIREEWLVECVFTPSPDKPAAKGKTRKDSPKSVKQRFELAQLRAARKRVLEWIGEQGCSCEAGLDEGDAPHSDDCPGHVEKLLKVGP